MKVSKSLVVICISIMSTLVNGASLTLIPSATLNINGHYVEGEHIFGSFKGIDAALLEALILSSSDQTDGIYHAATISLTSDVNRLSFAFDSTAPDLATISASVLAASSDFVISLPLLSSLSGFFELVEYLGNTSFHSTMPTLATFASQSTQHDRGVNRPVFAAFSPF